jgi:hypothetical protein
MASERNAAPVVPSPVCFFSNAVWLTVLGSITTPSENQQRHLSIKTKKLLVDTTRHRRVSTSQRLTNNSHWLRLADLRVTPLIIASFNVRLEHRIGTLRVHDTVVQFAVTVAPVHWVRGFRHAILLLRRTFLDILRSAQLVIPTAAVTATGALQDSRAGQETLRDHSRHTVPPTMHTHTHRDDDPNAANRTTSVDEQPESRHDPCMAVTARGSVVEPTQTAK